MAYGDFKDVNRRTFAYKVLRDKAFNIAKNPKYDEYKGDLASVVYKFLNKKHSVTGIKNDNISNSELTEEWQKPIIRKFDKRKIHSPFTDNISWGCRFSIYTSNKYKGYVLVMLLIFMANIPGWLFL